jgi:hypothetical protein
MLTIYNYGIGNIRIYFIHRNTYFANRNRFTYYFYSEILSHYTYIFTIFEYYNSTINLF